MFFFFSPLSQCYQSTYLFSVLIYVILSTTIQAIMHDCEKLSLGGIMHPISVCGILTSGNQLIILNETLYTFVITFLPWIPMSCTLVAVSKIPTENPAAAVDKMSNHNVRHMGITARKIAFNNRKHRSSKLRLMSYLRRKWKQTEIQIWSVN